MTLIALLVVGILLAAASSVSAVVSARLVCAVNSIGQLRDHDCAQPVDAASGDATTTPARYESPNMPAMEGGERNSAQPQDRPRTDPSGKYEVDENGNGDGAPIESLCSQPQERTSGSKVKINTGLDLPGAAGAGLKAGLDWSVSQLVNFIIDTINNEKKKEQRVKAALDDLRYCFPDHNIVIAKPQDGNLQQMDGSELIQTVEISGQTYRVYIFDTGTFTWAEGNDLGWKNRAFDGWWDRSDDGRTVTFDRPPTPERRKDWKPGDEGCQVEGREPPDQSRYHGKYDALDSQASAAGVGMLVNDLRRCYPDYNVLAMHEEQGGHWKDEPNRFVFEGQYNLNASEHDDGSNPRGLFNVYVFEDGTFVNDGDGGYNNWAWYGLSERGGTNGKEVTFRLPPPADLDPEPAHGSQTVDFDDQSPAYSEGTYPGTGFDGDKPRDKGRLIQSLIQEYTTAFPDTNILAVKNLNETIFGGISGLEHLAVVDGVDIFAIDEGTVTNTGHGGWQNWGFTGTYEYDPDRKVVAFTP